MMSPAQKIVLDGNGCENSAAISSSSVDIISSQATAIGAEGKFSSPSMIVSPLVSYDWEYKYYSTKLLATHSASGNIAWLIKGTHSKALVRIAHHATRVRSLLKNFDSDFLTLDFSLFSVPILAVLSFDGMLKIFHVHHGDAVTNLLISINLNDNNSKLVRCSLKWGPRLAIPEEHKDTSLLLAASLDDETYILDLNGITEQMSSNPIDLDIASTYYYSFPRLLSKMLVKLNTCRTGVEAMEFSADASSFFIGTKLGQILMFKLSDIKSGVLSPYLEWLTPENSPISTLHHFGHTCVAAPQGYLIGGMNFNRELCLWRLPDYSLVQSIRFCPDGELNYEKSDDSKCSIQPVLITHFDAATGLLLASDVKRTVLYTLHLSRKPDSPEEMQFQCVSEFPLVSPCIAFDANQISRSLSLDRPFTTYDPQNSDKIEVLLTLIHPRELQTGKLSFFVPINTYMQSDQQKNEKHRITESPVEKVPLSTVTDNCLSPVLPEAEKNSSFTNPFGVLTKMFGRRSNSTSQCRTLVPGVVTFPSPPTANPPSADSSTPRAASESEATPTTEPNGGNRDDDGIIEGGAALKKPFDSVPGNMSCVGDPIFNCGQNQISEPGLESLHDPNHLSDPVRSLAGSRSAASLFTSVNRDSSISDIAKPTNEIFAKLLVSSGNKVLSDSVQSLDANSIDLDVTSEPLKSSQIRLVSSATPTGQNALDNAEILRLLKDILVETISQANTIKTLMNEVRENKTNLQNLANVQNTVLKQVNSIANSSFSSFSSISTPITSYQIMEQLRKQKAETTKQLTQLETSMKNLQATVVDIGGDGASRIALVNPQSPSLLDKKQIQILQEQIRGIVRNELHLFQSNSAKILEPLRQHLRTSLEQMLGPLPQTVADLMASVVKDPKFAQYFSGQMSTAIAPSLATAYRDELQRVLVPAFAKGVGKLTKELDDLVKSSLNKHMQSVIAKMDSGVKSSRDKIDASTRKFDEQVSRLSKELSSKVQSQMNELKVLSVQAHQEAPSQLSKTPSLLRLNTSVPSLTMSGKEGGTPEVASTTDSKEFMVQGLKPAAIAGGDAGSKHPFIGSADTATADPYTIALGFIQNHQYAEALEAALTSTNQMVLLRVLSDVPVVQLFRQNVRQELLLSLIHQLSCGTLQDQLEMKISFLQEAVNHLRMNDHTVKELGYNILSMLVSKISLLRGVGTLTPAEENRAVVLLRTIQEKRHSLVMT